ncbi:MAG TPA: sterol desaturase family protein [Ignavibacteria bacterium]|nr:sterol desaturase family protein [Ignavibacteria bacterium]
MIINLIVLVVSFFGMEFIAWFSHKYIMHGFLWSLHKSHHTKRDGFFELNDVFVIIFASLGLMFIFVLSNVNELFLWSGIGISLYGIGYFLMHDILVHQRFKLFRNVKHKYLKSLIRTHKIHHKTISKEGADAFGFLWVPKRFRKITKSNSDLLSN